MSRAPKPEFRDQYAARVPAPAREGRAEPTRSPALAARICELIAAGHRLIDAAREAGFVDWRPVYDWLGEDPEFKKQYRTARRAGRPGGKLKRNVAAFFKAAGKDVGTFRSNTARTRVRTREGRARK